MSMEASISLEETNKIRVSLGLKPLAADDGDGVATANEDQEAEENYRNERDKQRKQREAKRVADGIAKVKNKRELQSSLKGATLADPGDNDESALKWVKRSKKKEKELAKKKLEELSKMDEEFLADYSEKDLAGLKVSHDLDAINEGEEQILTLKDSRILDNEEDELHNVELAEHEKTKKINELKVKKRDYTGYDDDEFDGGMGGMKRKILSKYDEDIDGPSESLGFRLGASVTENTTAVRQKQADAPVLINKALLNIDYAKNIEMSDYLKEGDIGFKKTKTKKRKPSRRAADLDDPQTSTPTDSMAVDLAVPSKLVRDLDQDFVDDDELQAALALQRRAKMRETRKFKPEDIAQRVVEEMQDDMAAERNEDASVADQGEGEGETGLLFDDTSEFVRSIGFEPPTTVATVQPLVKKEDREISIVDDVHSPEREVGELGASDDEDEAALHAMQMDVDAETKDIKVEADHDLGTSSEQTYRAGMGSTLTILRQQGILKTATPEQLKREKNQREQDLWLAEHRARDLINENSKSRSRGSARDQASREYDNRRREDEERKSISKSFEDYKPDVNIVYYDEFGRALTPKEAWKALSHRFHGKGSGKAKTEKRLKRIEEEKKKEAMVSGETPLSMNKAFQTRQEKAGQAHMVLSVGNRGAAPQVGDFLDTPQLSKKVDKKGKKKDTIGTAVGGDEVIAAPDSVQNGAVISAGPTTSSPVPGGMMKPSFFRIAPSSEPTSGVASGVSSPSGAVDRTKVTIGLKRKAGEEQSSYSNGKRRG